MAEKDEKFTEKVTAIMENYLIQAHMNPLSEMAASTESTALTKESFHEAIENARKILDSVEPLVCTYKLIASNHVGEYKTRFRFRTWKERLFSLPWRPRKKMEFYMVIVPNGEVIVDHKHGVIYGHPTDIYNLKVAIRNYDSDIIPRYDSIGDRYCPGKQGA